MIRLSHVAVKLSSFNMPFLSRINRLQPRKYIAQSLRAASTKTQKRAGDISDAFVSLSGQAFKPLPARYADLKGRLIGGHEDALCDSWNRLLAELRKQVPVVAALGSSVIPEIEFNDLDNPSKNFTTSYLNTGVAVVRNVIPEQEALGLKADLREYIKQNPHTKAFPPETPQVFELYWSPSQVRARGQSNLLKAQRFLMSHWHSEDPQAAISTAHPTSYADRLRMRQPGDAKFALGPHVDGGSVERWEEQGYGLGGVYNAIWHGEWEKFDPWESSCRLPVVSDMYRGVGACSMFRMAQGWLSLSETGPNEGTLLVNPLLAHATAYYLLRPFFSPKRQLEEFSRSASRVSASAETPFLSPDNWSLDPTPTSWLQGANPGNGQELSPLFHPHLDLDRTMVHIPRVNPGDYVVWHCDTIHAVDRVHGGLSDSSVMYIPACPLTEANAEHLVRQREAFVNGLPSPDFGGGEGESNHIGRVKPEDLEKQIGIEGRRAMGMAAWDSNEKDLSEGQKTVLNRANKILGYYD